MCKKRNKQNNHQPVIPETEQVFSSVETQPTAVPQTGSDYFNEYYKAYKNDYIEQYLRAYHKFKETGEEDDLVRELQGFDSDISSEKR